MQAQSQLLFLKSSALNRTKCVYLHGCVVMIKRFPPAGQWPISVLQKWCRENLAQSGSHSTADWTSYTPHKWWSLILHVGRVFSTCGVGALPLGQSHTLAWLNPVSTTSHSPVLFLLSLSLCSCRSLSALPQLCMKTKFLAPSVCRAHLISCRKVTMVSIVSDARGTLLFSYETWVVPSWLSWPTFSVFALGSF